MNIINKTKHKIYLLILVSLVAQAGKSTTWGFFGHRKINLLAIYTLPSPLHSFYRRHAKELQEMAVLPDSRRYILDEEAARHYIDLDKYKIDQVSFRTWEQMLRHTPEDSLRKHGIVPWHIPIVYKRLVSAFIKKDSLQIVKLSAELGHYVADAHVPLHTSSNYDGQKTGQGGLHSFWESRIPELLGNKLDQFSGPATYVPHVQQSSWTWVLASHKQLNDLFKKASQVSASLKEGEKYSFEQKGQSLVKIQSIKYSLAYHKALNLQIETRFTAAVKHVGDLWYSAWLEAGQPSFE
ncbi:MAG: hypothetical protein RI950_841 [Bacteroidota bacterium]|jgi:hypothetical protein